MWPYNHLCNERPLFWKEFSIMEMSYNEVVTITPRNYRFDFRKVKNLDKHCAMIGIAAGVSHSIPSIMEATNEKEGLKVYGRTEFFLAMLIIKNYKKEKDNV